MSFSGNEILWLFFIYSFLGWIYETIAAAVKQKRFVNKGLVNLPLCILYGSAVIFITVFGSELQGIWLYIGSVIMITVFKWVSGRLIERIYHERWWDYSDKRWNIDGYAYPLDSVLLGFVAAILIKWVNPLLVKVFDMLPDILTMIVIWVLSILLLLDILATLIAFYGKASKAQKWEKVDKWFTKLTVSLSQRIYEHVDKRKKRAYPQAKEVEHVEIKDNTVFAAGCSAFKVLWLFVIGAFLGDITETIFCRITAGVWIKGIYPKVSAWIEKTPVKLGTVLSWIMIVFMCCNVAVSSMALVRSTERQNGIPAEHTWQKIMDERFDDERLSRIYPNAIER